MLISSRALAWLGFGVALSFSTVAALRLYQAFTGRYDRAETLDDPLESAIVYMMAAAVSWIAGILAGHFLNEAAE